MAAANSDLFQVVKMVCPSAEELSVIVNNIRCTQCGLIFHNESRFRLHDLKVHQRKNLNKIVKEFVKYHCPESSCVYSPQSERYFTTMKYLKQHYLKVHAAKMYSCTQCNKSFSTEAAKVAHIRVCGLEFTCSCLKTFTTYEALLTHAKRHSHTVDEKYKNLLKRAAQKNLPAAQLIPIATPVKKIPISILPYQEKSTTTIVHDSISTNTRDISTQTDELKKLKRLQSPSKSSNKRRESRQTQTNVLSKEKRCRKTVETQTSPSARGSNKRSSASTKKQEPEQKQLMNKEDLALNSTFSNDNLQIFPSSPLPLRHDVQIEDLWGTRNNSETQTNSEKYPLDVFSDRVTQTDFIPFYDQEDRLQMSYKNNGSSLTSLSYTKNYFSQTNIRTLCSDPMLTEETFNDRFSSIETQTERPYLQSLFDSVGTISRTFALSSNIETQTTEHFDDMDHLLYSNMYTQTCNDILPNDLVLSDIQTQTAWSELEGTAIESNSTLTHDNNENNNENDDDYVKSNMSITTCRSSWLSEQQTSHTETQTDLLSIFDEFQ
ncbi:hypothetical protein PV327_007210 [Microctonus hyperodae]|uniref:C2H2-type domain-containing protein n=1 Tax=Microctonus hyperodae TaxID=165561 RepID=A0AA39KJA7_MICHY|nr:hypothetical protein PV327_007210 [Microctonus hyperodae]